MGIALKKCASSMGCLLKFTSSMPSFHSPTVIYYPRIGIGGICSRFTMLLQHSCNPLVLLCLLVLFIHFSPSPSVAVTLFPHRLRLLSARFSVTFTFPHYYWWKCFSKCTHFYSVASARTILGLGSTLCREARRCEVDFGRDQGDP